MSEIKQLQQVMEQNQARMKALRESFRSQISALVKEVVGSLQTLTRIEREFQLSDSQIQEYREMISHHQEQLARLRETGSAIEAKIAGLYTELSEHQQQITMLNATLMETQSRISTEEKDLAEKHMQLQSQEAKLGELQRKLEERDAEKKRNLSRYEEDLTKAKEKTSKIRKENPVADFLLSEGLEPPELDILAVLIHQKEVPIAELKRIAKTPPAITTRVLKDMENKGILELTDSDMARLIISL
jgi:chromosome segregation ATPase